MTDETTFPAQQQEPRASPDAWTRCPTTGSSRTAAPGGSRAVGR